MQLWSDEIDAMRPEARAVIETAMPALAAALDGGEVPDDPMEMLAFRRRAFAERYVLSDRAVDRTIAGVRCRTFVPDGPATAVYLHFHGGGMILGDPEMNDLGNEAMCDRFGMVVVSVEYRLAPEHPFPAGPDDGVAVARWVLEHAAAEWGTDRMLVGGESAGGYMAAAVVLRIRDELDAIDRVLGANLVFGVHDWGRTPSQRGIRPSEGPDMLTADGCASFGDLYLPGRSIDERRAPEVSPLFADLRGLCPAFMSVGTADHLLDDTLMLAPRWAAAGNDVELFVAPDMPHGFMAFPCGITSEWQAATDRWIAARLAD